MGLLPHRGYGEVEPVVVARGHRRQGVAYALLSRAIDEARRRNWRRLMIRPVARNAAAIRTFHAIGFTSLGLLELDFWTGKAGKGALVPVPGPRIAGRRFSV
jgi:GNAT superfamily N-acetyltransferase